MNSLGSVRLAVIFSKLRRDHRHCMINAPTISAESTRSKLNPRKAPPSIANAPTNTEWKPIRVSFCDNLRSCGVGWFNASILVCPISSTSDGLCIRLVLNPLGSQSQPSQPDHESMQLHRDGNALYKFRQVLGYRLLPDILKHSLAEKAM